MTLPGGMRWGLIMAAGGALWLLLAGPGRVLGWRTDLLGMALLMVCVGCLLYAVSRMPREALMRSASPAEWYARIGLGFTLIAMLYFFANLQTVAGTPVRSPETSAIVRNLVMLLIAWSVISGVVGSRWKGAPEQDERDREIAVQAAGWGRGALVFCVIGIAVALGLTPPDQLGWATPSMIAHVLIFALMWGWGCEYAATLVLYRRDRQGLA